MSDKNTPFGFIGFTATAIIGIIAALTVILSRPSNIKNDVSSGVYSRNTVITDLISSEVVRVKDGDTYVLKINGEEITVRLIGVDTPESVAPDEYSKENTSEGRLISEIVKQKIQPGDTLYVEYDVAQTDKYGRTLAYLYFEDGVMVQEWLLENGYARVMTVQPNCKYAERFATLYNTDAENI